MSKSVVSPELADVAFLALLLATGVFLGAIVYTYMYGWLGFIPWALLFAVIAYLARIKTCYAIFLAVYFLSGSVQLAAGAFIGAGIVQKATAVARRWMRRRRPKRKV